MGNDQNAVLVQYASLSDIEKMINRAVEKRMEEFYERIRPKPHVYIKRKEAAAYIGVSLPTLDAYTKAGLIQARHVGGRIFFNEEELLSFRGRRHVSEHFPVSE